MTHQVIDTNVACAANGRNTHANLECRLACVQALKDAIASRIVVLDNSERILAEYRRHLYPGGQPGLGDAFYKHLILHKYNLAKCLLVDTPTDPVTGEFVHFPIDPALVGFDEDDKKFVAAAVASGRDCPILNAVDTDWEMFRTALANNGVTVSQLCPQHMV